MPDSVALFEPGTDEYQHGTQPHNSSGSERPAFVAVPRSAEDVADIVVEAARRGLTVVPQATGHGAGGTVGNDCVIIDTSSLTDVNIDAAARTAVAGAGATWELVDADAEKHGLLGLAGSAPTVSVAGFTFGGGLGWLTRPHGMASSALRRVNYVDGAGLTRTAVDDAPEQIDRDALWAFRGGGGVGIATELEFDLVPITDLHAGYLLWTIDNLDAVVTAWSESMEQIGNNVATSIAVLHLPPKGPFPDALLGKPVVHLAVAANGGEVGASPLLDAVRAAAEPVIDTWGPADAKKLGGIHLDPPTATPAIGDARWLTADAHAHAADILSVAAAADSPLNMIEIRDVRNDAVARPGAESAIPGPYILHAVGALVSPGSREGVEKGFAQVRDKARAVDAGRSVGSWMEGAESVPDALPDELRNRVAAIAEEIDPDHVIRRSRYLA